MADPTQDRYLGGGPEEEPAGMPRWVKVLGVVLAILVLVVVVMLLVGGGGGGGHGPARHGSSGQIDVATADGPVRGDR